MIVSDIGAEAMDAARHLVAALDDEVGAAIRSRSLDTVSAGAAIGGDPDHIRAELDAYRAVGIDAFIPSGYPHRRECERFARLVLDDPPHAPLAAR